LTKKRLPEGGRRLQQFGKPFFEHFRRSETRDNAQLLLKGLLSDIAKKNVESIAYRYEQDRQALQRFVGQTDWNHKPLLDRLDEQGEQLPHPWIMGDDELGKSSWFRRELRRRMA
jgi:SRSO17 transposase